MRPWVFNLGPHAFACASLSNECRDAGGKKATSQKFTWWTSDPKVARFDDPKKGKLRLLKKGTCKIWAKAHDGKNSPKVKVKVW